MDILYKRHIRNNLHNYKGQLSDSRDDHTLDCGVWGNELILAKKCTEYHTNLILVLNLIFSAFFAKINSFPPNSTI